MAGILDHDSDGDEDRGKCSVANSLICVFRLYFFLIYELFLCIIFLIHFCLFFVALFDRESIEVGCTNLDVNVGEFD